MWNSCEVCFPQKSFEINRKLVRLPRAAQIPH